MIQRAAGALLLFSSAVPGAAQAASVTVTVGELDTAIEQMENNDDAIERLVLERIERVLSDADLKLGEGELLLSESSENLIDDNSCTRTEVRRVYTSVALASDTALSFSLSSINEPVKVDLEINARVEAAGRAKQTLGFQLGHCQQLAEDNFSFQATGDLNLSLSLRLVLNPVLETGLQRLVLRPVVTLDGVLNSSDVRVDVDDSLMRSALERILEDEIDDALSASELARSLARLQSSLKDSLNKKLDQGVLVVDLPSPDDEQVSRLYTLLSPEGDFSLSLGYLRVKRIELLAALITGDDKTLKELLSRAAQCEAAGILQTSLAYPPVYRLAGNGCESVKDGQLDNADTEAVGLNDVGDSVATSGYIGSGTLYSDTQCQRVFDFQSSSDTDYCEYVLDTERLGNAAADTQSLNSWALSPGTRFDIGALPLEGRVQPFTQRVSYKQVGTAQGECSLEMRIHTITPDAIVLNADQEEETSATMVDSNTTPPALKPLIAFHGGSWQRRSSGALGIESVATQFANEGYVVFAPFYRLIDTDEGNAACNNASLGDVLEDANDALDWVIANSARYGAAGKPAVFGQSAGGHMSAVLAVERPDDIASAVLFYAPTDFTDFANQLVSGQIVSETGQGILETVVDQTLDTLDINAPLIRRNSLPARIVEEGIVTPPFFMLHGMNDTVLPFRQSVRLCDALAGNPDTGAAANAVSVSADDPYRTIVNCGFDASELHLITEGEHALDLCIAEDLCLAGSVPSAERTADSIQRMLGWLKEVDVQDTSVLASNDDVGAGIDDPDNENTTEQYAANGSASTGGSTGWIVLVTFFFCLFLRRRFYRFNA